MSDFIDPAVCAEPRTLGIALKIADHQPHSCKRLQELTFENSGSFLEETSSIESFCYTGYQGDLREEGIVKHAGHGEKGGKKLVLNSQLVGDNTGEQ